MKYFFCTTFVFLILVGCMQINIFASSDEDVASSKQAVGYTTKDTKISPRGWRERDRPFVSMVQAFVSKRSRQNGTNENSNVSTPEVQRTTSEAKKNWTPLFDGESTVGWAVPVYGGDGEVDVQEGNLVIGRGEQMTGIQYKKEFPKIDYELRYEAQRTEGYDFFAACTFPVKENCCTFVNGGWGGGAVGLSSVNGYDASENETSAFFEFKEKTWYRFRILVKENKIQVWITPQDKEGNWEEEKSLVDLDVDEDTRLSTRLEMDQYKPLGFCTWSTEGRLRNIEWRTNARNE